MDTNFSKTLFKKCDDVAEVLSSISHPVRLKVLCSLIQGERSVGELTEICEISQPAMSQFLNRMKEDDLIASHRDGQRVYYSLTDKRLMRLLAAIKEAYCD